MWWPLGTRQATCTHLYTFLRDPGGDVDQDGFAGLFGAQLGYSHQVGNIVYGLEGDWAWTSFKEGREFDNGEYYVKARMDWLATLRARLGLAAGNAMVYATAGLALAELDHCANSDTPCSRDGDNDTRWNGVLPGLAVGTGVEVALGHNLSFKGEYLYVQMDTKNIVYDVGQDDDLDFSNRSHL